MRPPRVAILVLFFSASLFLVCRSISSIRRQGPTITTSSPAEKSYFRSLFSFTAPFSLFPPSAAISLTDDNSTFFAARPAAFGPPLPSNGLSGQLWIGSGFTDETLQEGEGEGELGCSDIPGWQDGRLKLSLKTTGQALAGSKPASSATDAKHSRRDDPAKGPLDNRDGAEKEPPRSPPKPVNDGTDDYLHQGFQQPKSSYSDGSTASGSGHADIQSIQETAEITGKIALLSRGGCGFLEKVKWAQRRGAIALIVGDNQKGGPLIQMFARGNVDNVTIPSVFTSRTTAHLLSSLMQPGSFIEDILDENGNPILKVQQSGSGARSKRSTLPAKSPSKEPSTVPTAQGNAEPKNKRSHTARRSWFSHLFHWGDSSSAVTDRSRPPSSGRLDWVLVDDWSDENDRLIKNSLDKPANDGEKSNAHSDSTETSRDGFHDGVHDWRDPDPAGPSTGSTGSSRDPGYDGAQSSKSGPSSGQAGSGSSVDIEGPKGGSITPGSGEYVPGVAQDHKKPELGDSDSSPGTGGGLLSKIFGAHGGANDKPEATVETPSGSSATATSTHNSPAPGGNGVVNNREGLWVTITPTGNASPFFDTLLVLVISPLITLTVVYALLILRVKIRMRRWRAPKSVVDRLPVRTYHTVPSPNQTPRVPSPTSSSPTTPLLQGPSRSRPRSRTTTGVPESGDLLRADDTLQASRTPSHEKGQRRGSSEWKKYMGRQVECVVCLEEYVDGVSRVMSLPCGHEFHAECITPWLTTRRRTCPICKGDVVRSLARGSGSSPRYEPFREDSYDSSDAPDTFENRIAMSNQLEDRVPGADVERGPGWAQAVRQDHEVWFNALSGRFGGSSSTSAGREGSGSNRIR